MSDEKNPADELQAKLEELQHAAIECGLGVLLNGKAADDHQVTIAAAVIRTLGPEPLGLLDIAEAITAGAQASMPAQKPQHAGRSMPPGKG